MNNTIIYNHLRVYVDAYVCITHPCCHAQLAGHRRPRRWCRQQHPPRRRRRPSPTRSSEAILLCLVAPSNGNVDDEVEGIDDGELPVEVVESASLRWLRSHPLSSSPVAVSAPFTSAVLSQLPMPMEVKNTVLLMLPVRSVARRGRIRAGRRRRTPRRCR